MKFKELIEQREHVDFLSSIQMRSYSDINILFATNYWDGILEGICELEYKRYEGENQVSDGLRKFYFKCFNERIVPYEEDDPEPTGWWRRYALLVLPEEEMKFQIDKYDDFKRWVGDHCDYENNKRKESGKVLPQDTHHLFYNKYPSKDFKSDKWDEYEVLSYFEIGY